jgi:hypothetical protein
MDFWNIAVPSLIFLAPVLAIVILGLSGGSSAKGSTAELRWVAGVFGISLLAAIGGVVRFDQPVKLELLLALSTEPSGYFEFAFQLHWMRFLWIAFAAAILLALTLFDGARALAGENKASKLSFLLGSFLFSAMAFLSENTLLSLMFIEVTVFLLYAFSVRADGSEGELERVSYFKRASFIFLSLLAMLGLAATGQFGVNSIMLLGFVLYALSFLFSKHTFPDWRYVPLVTLQAGALFFLLGRIMKEGMSPELWVPLAGTFGVATAAFCAFSTIALTSLSASFWALFSFVCYFFFMRFGTNRPDDVFWGAYEVVALASAYALTQLVRYGRSADQSWKKGVSFVCAAILLGIVSGAVPGGDAGLARGINDPFRMVAFGALTFFLAFVSGKALKVSFSKDGAADPANGAYGRALAPAALAILAHVGVAFRIIDIYGENPFRLGLAYILSTPAVLVAGSTLVAGLALGALLGANSSYLAWAKVKEKRMEDLFPRIDPSLIRWNEQLAAGPDRLLRWVGAHAESLSDRAAGRLESADHKVFGDRLYRGFRSYSSSLSYLVRYLHSGSVRAYLFMGILVTLFSAFLFLLEGR